jgi:hypothetical protein
MATLMPVSVSTVTAKSVLEEARLQLRIPVSLVQLLPPQICPVVHPVDHLEDLQVVPQRLSM